MKIDLIPIEDFIKLNHLQEVTEPILFEKGNIPTTKGLLSTEIFGNSVRDRKETFAYIQLNGYFFVPFIYKLLKRMDRRFDSIVNGTKKFIIDSEGQLVQDDEKGDTGIEWLYKNWDKLKFKRNDSRMRNERIDVLEVYKKDVIFTKYFIIIPPFFRDVNLQKATQGIIGHDEINDKYAKLLRLASMLNVDSSFDFTLYATRAKIQELMVEIYDLIKGKVEKKQGLIRKSLLSKNIDYGVRSVISAPTFNANRYDDMEVDFYHTGVPLAQVCALFTPFIVSWVKRFFQREIEQIGMRFPKRSKSTGEIIYIKLQDPALYFNEDFIKKKLDKFIFSYADRFEKVELPVDPSENIKEKIYLSFKGYESATGVKLGEQSSEKDSPLRQREATWTDIFFMAADEVTKDKHVEVTRYPVLDYFGTFFSKITILTTHTTVPMYVGNKFYRNYPKVDFTLPKEEVGLSFIDTVTMSNVYLQGLGGIHQSCHLLVA